MSKLPLNVVLAQILIQTVPTNFFCEYFCRQQIAQAQPAPVAAAAPVVEPQPHDEITDEAYTNKKSSVILWNRDEIEENPPELEYEDFMGTRAGLKKMLKNVCKYGISIMKGNSSLIPGM